MKRSLFALAVVLVGCGSANDFSNIANPTAPTVSTVGEGSFIDPTATVNGQLTAGGGVYIAPFVRLNLGASRMRIGDNSDIQDNVTVEADSGREVRLGDQAILAHGCSVLGPAVLGTPGGQPVFVGFNARVEAASMEPRSMVSARARLAPGIVLHSGKKVLPGRNVTTQQEADDNALGKVTDVTADDDVFMQGVLTVNVDLAHGYNQLAQTEPSAILGIGPDPITPIHPEHILPTFNGQAAEKPDFRNRIIGDIRFADPFEIVNSMLGQRDSLRADEGGPFVFGTGLQASDEVTVHALEHSEIDIGANCRFALHSVIHGGEDLNAPNPKITTLGNNIRVGAGAVVFRSTVGDNCIIGAGALVDSCTLTPGTVVPPNRILIGNADQGTITW